MTDRKPPERIFLQWHGMEGDDDDPIEVTWCQDKININDVEYVLEQHPDSKRLDWLEEEDAGIYFDTDGHIGVARGDCDEEFCAGDSLREAIDKAMEEE